MSLCINPSCPRPENPPQHRYCQACGSELMLVSKYWVNRLLSAKGGFANTYEVIDIHNNTLKVLKVLTYRSPKAIELFQKEALVLSKLNHPGIPKGEGLFIFYPKDSEEPLHCLVMEKIEGQDLEEYQKKHNHEPISQDLAIDWLLQLADILDEVHRRNFFHRDIKPSNIIVQPDNHLVLIDFGAVRQITGTILSGGKATGIYTPGYAPPEQERGYAIPESDFYALGRTFVYLLTGKDPNAPEMYNQQENRLEWRPFAPQIAPLLADFIDNLIADKPSDRPNNTKTLLKKLHNLKHQLSRVNNHNNSTLIFNNFAGFFPRWQASMLDTFFSLFLAAIFGYITSKYILKIPISYLVYTSKLSALSTTLLGSLVAIILIFSNLDNYSLSFYFYIILFLIGGLTKWLYYIILEASPLKGTLGKIIVGIRVVNLEGKKISFKQANQRYWSKVISSLIGYMGYLPIYSKKKQCLHDKIAKTQVISLKK